MASSPPRPRFAPIPQRMPPLTWRQPFFLWTPMAVALAIGWPALMLRGQSGLFQIALFAGSVAVAVVVITLIVRAVLKRPPYARRSVIRTMVWAGILAAIAAPFILLNLVGATPTLDGAPHDTGLGGVAAFAMAPLALLLGLPIALFSGIVFSLVALVKPKREEEPVLHATRIRVTDVNVGERERDVQPFY